MHNEARLSSFEVSQTDFATMCGLSRQTMSKVLGHLVERGIIRLGYRRIEIINSRALHDLAINDDRVWR